MKWTGIFLVGYVVFIAGVIGALWKLGVLADIGAAWTAIGIIIAIGIGIMLAVSNSSGKENL